MWACTLHSEGLPEWIPNHICDCFLSLYMLESILGNNYQRGNWTWPMKFGQLTNKLFIKRQYQLGAQTPFCPDGLSWVPWKHHHKGKSGEVSFFTCCQSLLPRFMSTIANPTMFLFTFLIRLSGLSVRWLVYFNLYVRKSVSSKNLFF